MKTFFLTIIVATLFILNGFSQLKSGINVYELDRLKIEEIFPCWYSFDVFSNKCSLDSVDLPAQIVEMDSIIALVTDSINRYYKEYKIKNGTETLTQAYDRWKETREKLTFLYFKNFEIGTSRGIQETAYRRDLTKQFLICVLPILRMIPE